MGSNQNEPRDVQARALAGEVRGGQRAIGTQAPKQAPAAGSQELTDAVAVDRAREGDHEAFRVLVERYQGRVYRLALRILRDEERARDAVQDAFLKVYGALGRFEGRSSFYTWMYRLVFNLCLDLRRRDRSGREVEWEEDRGFESALSGVPGPAEAMESGMSEPARALERSELRRQLAEAIETLPEDARQTLVLREVDGLSYAEIAEVMDIPKGTVMSRLHYARRKLREQLSEAGVTPEGVVGDEVSREGEPRVSADEVET